MSEDEFIEVPVTRRARVTRVGVLSADGLLLYVRRDRDAAPLMSGDLIACKVPGAPGWFRPGVAGVLDTGGITLAGISGASDGDIVYRVEGP